MPFYLCKVFTETILWFSNVKNVKTTKSNTIELSPTEIDIQVLHDAVCLHWWLDILCSYMYMCGYFLAMSPLHVTYLMNSFCNHKASEEQTLGAFLMSNFSHIPRWSPAVPFLPSHRLHK